MLIKQYHLNIILFVFPTSNMNFKVSLLDITLILLIKLCIFTFKSCNSSLYKKHTRLFSWYFIVVEKHPNAQQFNVWCEEMCHYLLLYQEHFSCLFFSNRYIIVQKDILSVCDCGILCCYNRWTRWLLKMVIFWFSFGLHSYAVNLTQNLVRFNRSWLIPLSKH